jgi:RNA polymerase sigma factor (sigma-70 family)
MPTEPGPTSSVSRRTSGVDIIGVREGDAAALGALYDTFGAALYRLAYRVTGTREDAEDVVQDVFVGLPEALGRYQERGQFNSWLKRVTLRIALMHLRTPNRRRQVSLEAAAEIRTQDGDVLASADLQSAIAALPNHLRLVLVLKEFEGYSHGEVAEVLGITVGASRVRLLRAISALRRQLGGSQ